MKFNVEGRIRNMRLPDGKTALIYSIYEAVFNGVHAIEERFGEADAPSKGVIKIEVHEDDERIIERIEVSDNGIGLNDRHLRAFDECDTLDKVSIGGRGVGRLVWFKAFSEIGVRSTYEAAGQVNSITFQFDPLKDDSCLDLRRGTGQAPDIGTTILLSGPKTSQTSKLTMALLARSLCHQFFPYFIGGSMPKLIVAIEERWVDVGQYLADRMEVAHAETVDLSDRGLGKIEISHVYVEPKIAREAANSILLTAHKRVVTNIEIEKKFALKSLGGKGAYACVVKGDFLDEKVDQERTGFKALEAELNAIADAAMDRAEKFLHEHIAKIRNTQKGIVVALLEEHPQLAVSVEKIDDYVGTLAPSMSDEDIGKTLFTLLYRHEKRLRAQIERMGEGQLGAEMIPQEAIDELTRKVNDDAKRRLAEYTIKRHQIIQIARSMLRYSDPEQQRYQFEKSLHGLICPMGRMLSNRNYSDHNLWLVDDLLSYYQFFASDKALSALTGSSDREEPDLLFLNPFGFRREGTNDPVVIVEFKRPGDEQLSSDPIDQVLGYIEKLKQRTVRDVEGEVINEIGPDTPFECIVICDLTEAAKKKFERSVAQLPTPDGMGYYGFSIPHKAAIRVISYRKLFRDAELRNQKFFEHLGLLPEEVRKAMASATATTKPASEPLSS